jgi:hypothetical protein
VGFVSLAAFLGGIRIELLNSCKTVSPELTEDAIPTLKLGRSFRGIMEKILRKNLAAKDLTLPSKCGAGNLLEFMCMSKTIFGE